MDRYLSVCHGKVKTVAVGGVEGGKEQCARSSRKYRSKGVWLRSKEANGRQNLETKYRVVQLNTTPGWQVGKEQTGLEMCLLLDRVDEVD